MPIYAYKCASCGHAKDVLQKMSEAPLQRCPACGEPAFLKQVTAAGFQLKGSGWYATDFKSKPKSADGANAKDDAGDSKRSESNGESSGSDGKSDNKAVDKPAAKADNQGGSRGDTKSDGKSTTAPAASSAPAPAPKPSGSKPPAGG